jgi:hypothetical protein
VVRTCAEVAHRKRTQAEWSGRRRRYETVTSHDAMVRTAHSDQERLDVARASLNAALVVESCEPTDTAATGVAALVSLDYE